MATLRQATQQVPQAFQQLTSNHRGEDPSEVRQELARIFVIQLLFLIWINLQVIVPEGFFLDKFLT